MCRQNSTPNRTIMPTVVSVRIAAPLRKARRNSPRIGAESATPAPPAAEASVAEAIPA